MLPPSASGRQRTGVRSRRLGAETPTMDILTTRGRGATDLELRLSINRIELEPFAQLAVQKNPTSVRSLQTNPGGTQRRRWCGGPSATSRADEPIGSPVTCMSTISRNSSHFLRHARRPSARKRRPRSSGSRHGMPAHPQGRDARSRCPTTLPPPRHLPRHHQATAHMGQVQ